MIRFNCFPLVSHSRNPARILHIYGADEFDIFPRRKVGFQTHPCIGAKLENRGGQAFQTW